MNILHTYIVCRITNTVFKTPKFFKVYEVLVENGFIVKTAFILDDRGEMEAITKAKFEELQNNMKELGL